MKKLLICGVLVLSLFGLTGCQVNALGTPSEFVYIKDEGNYDIVYHRDTKVMYVVSDGRYNRGIFTVMVDTDGSPLLYKGK